MSSEHSKTSSPTSRRTAAIVLGLLTIGISVLLFVRSVQPAPADDKQAGQPAGGELLILLKPGFEAKIDGGQLSSTGRADPFERFNLVVDAETLRDLRYADRETSPIHGRAFLVTVRRVDD